MASRKELQMIRSLKHKKYRQKYGLFLVEGEKSVKEHVAAGFEPVYLWGTESFEGFPDFKHETVTDEMMKLGSFLKNPSPVLAVFRIPVRKSIPETDGLRLVLDEVRDPGNLGTIIRLADWYGLKHIFCSENTVDVYNPKVIQSAMGSTARVSVFYTNIVEYLKGCSVRIFISTLEGNDLYRSELPRDMVLIMGNESHGVRREIAEQKKKIHEKLRIPGANPETDSLNVGIATGIFLSEWYRRYH